MAQSKQGKKPKLFVAFHAVNQRERMVPQLPAHSFGNFYRKATATSPVEIEKDYCFLVSEIRNGIMEINAEYGKKLQEDDGYLELVKKGDGCWVCEWWCTLLEVTLIIISCENNVAPIITYHFNGCNS